MDNLLNIEQKQEAIKRMKILKLNNIIIEEFNKNNNIYISVFKQKTQIASKIEQDFIKYFESSTNNVVYHIILDNNGYGNYYTLLYVSNNKSCWKYDKEFLKNNRAIVYVTNMTETIFIDYGYIEFKTKNGIIKRK